MTLLADLEARYPFIDWREPIPVATPAGDGLACRVCIAADGLRANEVPNLPQTREEWDLHFAHHLGP